MRVISRFVLLLLIIGGFCTTAYGDGKIFAVEEVPADIPYQRAFFIFHEGFETLILQSKYEFSQAADVNSIGWVVPIPTVPELGSIDAINSEIFFRDLSIGMRPYLFHISALILLLVVILFFVCAVMMLILYGMESLSIFWSRMKIICAIIIVVCFFMFLIFIPNLKMSAGVTDVEVVKAEQVGIYDVRVIKGDSAEDIVDWLKENEFSFSENDVEVFEDYVNKKWCFVTAKVRQDIETVVGKISAGGLVDPLIMKFETDKAIYPLALTSVIGTETEVLLYTLSENKLSCNKRMKLRYSGSKKTESLLSRLLNESEPDLKAMFDDIPEEMTICKFKEKLTPEQMKQDIEFEDAPDNKPYRETKIVW